MKTRYPTIIAWLTLVLILPGFCAQASDPPVRQAPITLAMTHLPPYRIMEDGQASGILIQAMTRILAPMNLKIIPVEAPFKRCLLMLKEGRADIYIGLFRTPEREAYLHYIEPPFQTKTVKVFYMRKGEGHKIRSYEDLYTLENPVGIRAGFKNFPRFDADDRIKKEGVSTDEQNLVKLSLGRINAFLHTEEVGDYLIETLGYAGLFEKAPYRPDLHNPAYVVISKKSRFTARAGEFEDAVRAFVLEGQYREVKEAYFTRLKAMYGTD